MPLNRRTLLLAAPSLLVPGLLLPGLLLPSAARADDPRMSDRAVGADTAPVSVIEYFSLTCPHCARFARDTFPKIQAELIEPGKLRYIFRDYPLDKVALMAAQVARALPPARYEPFTMALLASQDRWAFARDVNSTDELAKMAALAGLSRPAFDAAIGDTALQNAILAEQQRAEATYHVDSTPTFIFNGPNAHDRRESGELSYDTFARFVAEAGGTTG